MRLAPCPGRTLDVRLRAIDRTSPEVRAKHLPPGRAFALRGAPPWCSSSVLLSAPWNGLEAGHADQHREGADSRQSEQSEARER
jgi:hypothetical protein